MSCNCNKEQNNGNGGCTCDCASRQAVEVASIQDIPVYAKETLPDYFLMESDVEDTSTGNIKRTLVRMPTDRIVPNGTYDNISVITSNNSAIAEVPEGQVLAGYVKNEGSSNVVYLADADNQAQFLIVGILSDGQLLIQPCGVVNITAGHKYIVGVQYYTGDGGEPVADSASGQKLFIPISNTKLLINL